MQKKNRLYDVLKVISRPIFKLIYHYKLINQNNIPSDGKYILACNHTSNTDPILLGLGQKRYLYFMAKKELFSFKPLAWFFTKMGAFPVDRGKNDIGAVRHFEEVISNGNVMGIFIEGKRSKTGEFLPPKNGVSLLAFDTQTPVIPACITKIGHRKYVHFGDVLTIEDLGFTNGNSKELRAATRIIMDKIIKLREIDIDEANKAR